MSIEVEKELDTAIKVALEAKRTKVDSIVEVAALKVAVSSLGKLVKRLHKKGLSLAYQQVLCS